MVGTNACLFFFPYRCLMLVPHPVVSFPIQSERLCLMHELYFSCIDCNGAATERSYSYTSSFFRNNRLKDFGNCSKASFLFFISCRIIYWIHFSSTGLLLL